MIAFLTKAEDDQWIDGWRHEKKADHRQSRRFNSSRVENEEATNAKKETRTIAGSFTPCCSDMFPYAQLFDGTIARADPIIIRFRSVLELGRLMRVVQNDVAFSQDDEIRIANRICPNDAATETTTAAAINTRKTIMDMIMLPFGISISTIIIDRSPNPGKNDYNLDSRQAQLNACNKMNKTQ
mmetsp:Transcript_19238/g.54562  ORF Transcript_19238/g.54562 Transcript_19238/m.54562 type:complete len:183 (-) Transcript_19238:78-626(-)